MRRQWSTLVVLVGSLVFLASLYLPWQADSPDAFYAFRPFGDLAPKAALFALTLAALALTAVVRPDLADRLPVGTSALLTSYFGLAQLRSVWVVNESPKPGYGLGAYLGVTAALVVLFGVGRLRVDEIVAERTDRLLIGLGLTAALLTTYLMPWTHLADLSFLGPIEPAVPLAAAIALCIPAWSTVRKGSQPTLSFSPLQRHCSQLEPSRLTRGFSRGRTEVGRHSVLLLHSSESCRSVFIQSSSERRPVQQAPQ
jgi:hypothetical protein